MPFPSLSLAVVGADYPNKGRSPGRRFEIELCVPGEPVELRREPKNRADKRAVAVYSCRGIQIGYLSAERAPWFSAMLNEGREIQAVFQRKMDYGAAIRAAFDGETPALPDESDMPKRAEKQEFWPDYIPPDD